MWEEIAIACLDKPAGALQMAIMHRAGAGRLLRRINPEQDDHHFLPVGSLGGCVEEAHIKLDMGAVIGGQFLTGWRLILKRLGHVIPPEAAVSSVASQAVGDGVVPQFRIILPWVITKPNAASLVRTPDPRSLWH